jgi:hypothetical protein
MCFVQNKILSLACLLFGALLLPVGACAAASGQLNISGTVAPMNSLVIRLSGSNSQSLNILGGEVGNNVASVDETSNDADGYTISLSSANGGELRLAGNPSISTAYSLNYGNNGFRQPSTSASTVKTVSSLPGLTTNTSSVIVQVTKFPTAPAGTYSDVVTLTIVANP